jgi:hypothetical protein
MAGADRIDRGRIATSATRYNRRACNGKAVATAREQGRADLPFEINHTPTNLGDGQIEARSRGPQSAAAKRLQKSLLAIPIPETAAEGFLARLPSNAPVQHVMHTKSFSCDKMTE